MALLSYRRHRFPPPIIQHAILQPEVLGRSYMRIFRHGGMTYALAMPGLFYRSTDGPHAQDGYGGQVSAG
jgi:hypothetical protein